MNTSGTQSSALSLASSPPTADGLLQRRIKEIKHAVNQKIDTIKLAVSAYRRALGGRLWRSKEVEDADISVYHIGMRRGIEKERQDLPQKKTEGPIRILPAEMLSEIFRYHVEADLSPWTLVKVSKAWMDTAMATPHLWCRLLVVSKALAVQQRAAYVINGKKYYSVGSMQVCDDLSQLQAAFDRSGAVLPLTIKVELGTLVENSVFPFIILQLLGSPFSERIHDLDIGSVNIVDQRYACDMPVGPFPLLTSITLPRNIGPWIHKCLKSVSLTSRTFDRVIITGVIPTELTPHSFWRRVKRVVLPYKHRGLDQMISQLSALEEIQHLPKYWPNQDTPATVLRSIRQISLTCVPRYLDRLQLPRLETFTLYVYGCMAVNALSGYNRPLYPALVDLEVTVDDPLWPQYMAGAFPALLNLTLICTGDVNLIVAILKSVPSVRNVKILETSSDTSGIEMLRLLYLEEPLISPNLERLTLGNSGIHRVRTLKRNNGPLYQSLVKFRGGIRKPPQQHNGAIDQTKVPDVWEGLLVLEEAPSTGTTSQGYLSISSSWIRHHEQKKRPNRVINPDVQDNTRRNIAARQLKSHQPNSRRSSHFSAPGGWHNSRGDELVDRNTVICRPAGSEYPPCFASYPSPGWGFGDNIGNVIDREGRFIKRVG